VTTPISVSAAPPAQRRPSPYFYTTVALVVIAVVVIGFSRSYYLRPLFTNDQELTTLLHLHGVLMSLWFVLFFVQSSLVAARRVSVHRRLGWVTALVAAAVIIVGPQVAIATAAAGRAPPGVPPLAFMVVPLGDIFVFTVLFGLGIYWRKRSAYHKRVILLASVSMLPAAIARFPSEWIAAAGPLAYFGLTNLLIIGCAAYDTWAHRRLHPVFIWGTLFVIAMQIGRLVLSGTSAWMRFAEWLVQ
jgi:hypothetical protein